MASTDGKLVPSYEAHCAICETPQLGLGNTITKAKLRLKEAGWREHMAYGWCCEICSNRSTRLSALSPATDTEGNR